MFWFRRFRHHRCRSLGVRWCASWTILLATLPACGWCPTCPIRGVWPLPNNRLPVYTLDTQPEASPTSFLMAHCSATQVASYWLPVASLLYPFLLPDSPPAYPLYSSWVLRLRVCYLQVALNGRKRKFFFNYQQQRWFQVWNSILSSQTAV